MVYPTVDFEDRLTPIAAFAEELYLFSSVDGAIYRAGDPLALHLQSLPPRTFAVPGDRCLYSVADSDGSLSVHRLPLGGAVQDVTFLGPSGGRAPVAVIAGGTDRYVVLRHPSEDRATFVSLDTGRVVELRVPVGARPLFMTEAGHVVYQADETWGSSEPGTTPEPGVLTSWSAGGFVVVTDPKGQRTYTHIQGESRSVLNAPRGWSIRQAIVYRGGIVMVCLHPSLGYATWEGRRLIARTGTTIAHPLGDHAPVIRSVGCAAGSSWTHGAHTWRGVVPASPNLRVRTVSIDGCPSVLITTAGRSDQLLITMHGGPDSLEWDDLRYGGVYREIVGSGTDVLIVNYAGSQGLGVPHQRRAWQAWVSTLISLGSSIQAFSEAREYSRLKMLGVSFGAWAALITSTSADVERVTVASPILRMAPHLQRHSDDRHFWNWANVRFGEDHAAARAGDELMGDVRADVIAVVPASDRTIDVVDTVNACAAFEWQLVTVPGAHYPATIPDASARWQALRKAIAE